MAGGGVLRLQETFRVAALWRRSRRLREGGGRGERSGHLHRDWSADAVNLHLQVQVERMKQTGGGGEQSSNEELTEHACLPSDLSLCSSPPGVGEHGADHTLAAGVSG